MPRLWSDTIEAHRREVRDAVLHTTIRLVEERGLLGLTMSEIAEATGVGRATLYKYFPDVESILHAWHQRHIEAHLGQLTLVRDEAQTPWDRLAAVLSTYAELAQGSRGHADADLAGFLHGDDQVVHAEHHLRDMIVNLVKDAGHAGEVRDDVPHTELAAYCLHALVAARTLKSKSAIRRLVDVTLAGLRPD